MTQQIEVYEIPAIVYEGNVSTRAGSLPRAVDPGNELDLFNE